MRKKVVSHKSSVIILMLLFLLITYNLQLTTCFAQSISSTELINNAKQYDGKTVVYAGEVIGDVMRRGDFAWININDGKSALGIWINYSLVKDIVYTGSYKSRGDIVEITGIFQRACPQHGGDLDIHAQAIRKMSSGMPTPEELNLKKRNQVILLLGALCLVWILSRSKHR